MASTTFESETSGSELYSFDASPEETVPLLRLSLRKLQDYDPEESQRFFEESKDLGFLYLDLEGADNGPEMLRDVDSLFAVGKQLFQRGDLDQFDMGIQGGYYGYKCIGKGTVNSRGDRDRTEFFNVSKDDILSVSTPSPSPPTISQNRALIASFIRYSNSISNLLLTHLSTHLNLPPDFLPSLHRLSQPSGDQARFTHSPPQPPTDAREALGGHTDFGSLTVLFNRQGGLQVLLPPFHAFNLSNTSTWKYVRPLPGHCVINLGDALVKFTNGLLNSNIHRVMAPPGKDAGQHRYSLVYFQRPEDRVLLERLDGSGGVIPELKDGEVEEEISAREWTLRRALRIRGVEGKDWEGTERGRL